MKFTLPYEKLESSVSKYGVSYYLFTILFQSTSSKNGSFLISFH